MVQLVFVMVMVVLRKLSMKQYPVGDVHNAEEVVFATTGSPNKQLAKNQKRERVYAMSNLIGQRLLLIRKQIGLSSRDVCDKVPGLNKSHFSEWENGKKPIPIYWLVQLAKLYGVSLDYLVGFISEDEETRAAFHIKRIIIQSSQQYLACLADAMDTEMKNYLLIISSQQQTLKLSRQLLDAINRMIELNPEEWPDLRNGAKVEHLINELSASLKSTETVSRQIQTAKERRAQPYLKDDLFSQLNASEQ